MGEIVEERIGCRNSGRGNSGEGLNGNNVKKVEIILKTIGPAPPSRLLVPSSITVNELRRLISEHNESSVENLKLILKGKVLNDSGNENHTKLQLDDGDSLIVAVKPKPPSKRLQDEFDDEDSEEDLKFKLPESSSLWKKKLHYFLHDKLKLPDIVLMAIFSLSLKMWAIILIWFIMAPVAHRWNLGPLYILATGFCIILANLGNRKPGDMSAYSVFNDGFRELPGTLNADRLDRDIRLGQF